jgi:hypothetical protein
MFPRTLVIVMFLAAQTALLWYVAARDRTSEAHFAWMTTVMPPVPVAPAPPEAAPPPATPLLPSAPPATLRPSCPPMGTIAAQLPKDHVLPRGVNRVVTSWTNAAWLAAFDDEHVFVSTDGGLSFEQVLDGPGAVRDVTFDCFGRPVVLRDGNRVGVRDQSREQWRSVPGMGTDDGSPNALIGGGPDVLVVGVDNSDTWHARVAVSADLGATWWYRDLADYWEQSTVAGHQNTDGSIDVAITTADCMTDLTTWVRIGPDGKVTRDELGDIGRISVYDDIAIATYGYHKDGEYRPGWKRFGDEDWHAIAGLPDGATQIVAGPLPHMIAGEVSAIYPVDSKHHAAALRPWPYGTSAAIDRAGRLWAIDETKDGEDAWLVTVPHTRAKIPPPETLPSNE